MVIVCWFNAQSAVFTFHTTLANYVLTEARADYHMTTRLALPHLSLALCDGREHVNALAFV